MLAGLLIAVPVWAFIYAWDHPDWQPHGVVGTILLFTMVAGIVWLR